MPNDSGTTRGARQRGVRSEKKASQSYEVVHLTMANQLDWGKVKKALRYRFVLRQNDDAKWEDRFAVYDTLLRRYTYRSSSKGMVIKEVQRRNGFRPVDGEEESLKLQQEFAHEHER